MNRDEIDTLFYKMRELPECRKDNLLCDLFAKMEGVQITNGEYFPHNFFQEVQEEVHKGASHENKT